MDLATLMGLVVGIGLIVGAMMIEVWGSPTMIQDLAVFGSASSMLIVVGGTLAAAAVAFRLNEVIRVFTLIKYALTKPKFVLYEIVQEIIDLSELNRKGPTELEQALPNIKTHFLKDGVEFITQGLKLDDIKEILEQREAFRYYRESHESDLMKTMGIFAPAFGMVGTLIGLVFMLKEMEKGGSDLAAMVAKKMSVALITTFYGAIVANLIFNPFAEKIKSRNKENSQAYELMIEGIALLYQKKHPLEVRDKLTAYITPSERMKYFSDKE